MTTNTDRWRTEEERDALRAENERFREQIANGEMQLEDMRQTAMRDEEERERLRNDVRRLRADRDQYAAAAQFPHDPWVRVDLIDEAAVPCHDSHWGYECDELEDWLKKNGA